MPRGDHLDGVPRGNAARWPTGADRCPSCGGEAEFAVSTTTAKCPRFAHFQCGSCDTSWRADRTPDKPKSHGKGTKPRKKYPRQKVAA